MYETFKVIFKIEKSALAFVCVIILCSVCIIVLLTSYFGAYTNPFMIQDITDISTGWTYTTENNSLIPVETLRTGLFLNAGETLIISRIMTESIDSAAILIRANHQTVNVLLDGVSLFTDMEIEPDANPGMALHFVSLPDDYIGKTLTLEITSPYNLYSGRTSTIMLGSIISLEAWALSHSMRSIVMMAMCLFLGVCTIVITLAGALKGVAHPETLCIGIFAVIWSLYYVCTEYISFQFFSPAWMSAISLGLYFTFAVPLSLCFYFSFKRCRKLMLPVVIAYTVFSALAITGQLLGWVDLPKLVNINNILLAGLAYIIVLTVIEAFNRNYKMVMAVPFLIIAYISMLYNFAIFYRRQGSVPYSYRDTYFLLILFVLIYNVFDFFRGYYGKLQESEVLRQLNRVKTDFLVRISHEMKTPLTVMSNSAELTKMQIEADATDEETLSVLSDIALEAQRLGRMVEKLLDIAVEKQERIDFVRLSVSDLIERVASVAEPMLEKKGNRLELKVHNSIPDVCAGADLITQVLLNLLTNSNRHCNDGVIVLSARRRNNRFVEISVSDNGDGFPSEVLSRAFEWGESGDGGTGFGLAIAKDIVETHGGEIDIANNPGEGAEIKFTLQIYTGDSK